MAHAICKSRFPFDFFERKGSYNFLQQTLIKQCFEGMIYFLRLHIFMFSSNLAVSLVVVVFLIVVFAAHCRNIYSIFPHGSTHVIDTAAQGIISSSAVVQEGGQED